MLGKSPCGFLVVMRMFLIPRSTYKVHAGSSCDCCMTGYLMSGVKELEVQIFSRKFFSSRLRAASFSLCIFLSMHLPSALYDSSEKLEIGIFNFFFLHWTFFCVHNDLLGHCNFKEPFCFSALSLPIVTSLSDHQMLFRPNSRNWILQIMSRLWRAWNSKSRLVVTWSCWLSLLQRP